MTDALPTPAERARLNDDLAFWQQQSDRLDTDARRLKFVPLIGTGLSLAAAALHAPLWVIVGLFGVGLVVGLMAVYMVIVRRQEHRQQVAETQAKLAALPADPDHKGRSP